MRKHFVLVPVVLITLLFLFASQNKMMDVKPVKNIKKGNIPSTAMVKPDLNFGKFPLYFISNQGQVNKNAVFYAKASRYTLWLTKEGLVFDSFKGDKGKENIEYRTRNVEFRRGKYMPRPQAPKIERDVSKLFFVNAGKNVEMEAVNETRLRVNYFKGNDRSKWYGNIPTSQAVLYRSLYKNIDLKVYGIEKQIEYDWIVKPGGNPKDIRFQYKNVKGTRLDKNGDLLIETNFGELIHKKPVSYQCVGAAPRGRPAPCDRRVDVKFKKISENTYGFEVGKYDKNFELIIDPVVLAYSTYLGGDHYDHIEAISVDGSGNAYVTGETWGSDFPILNQYQIDQGSIDAFITKIDTTQSGTSSLVYSTYLGGSSSDTGFGIAVDKNGYTYVTGRTGSSDFPSLNPYQSSSGGDNDVFVTKLDTNGTGASSLLYSTYLGGYYDDYGRGIAVDDSENAYITGYTSSTDFPVLNQYMNDPGDDWKDAFVTKIDTTQAGASSLSYSTYLGGNGDDYGREIAVDNMAYAYVTGYTFSTDFPTLNQYQADQGNDDCDAFVTKIDTTQSGSSSLLYSTYLGGSGYDYGYSIAVDNNAYAYITGFTASLDFPILNQFMTGTGVDAFVTKLDTTETGASCLIYSTYLGGSGYTEGYGIALDNIGYVYVTGYTVASNFPTQNQYQSYQGGDDVYITKLDTTQSGASCLIFSTYLGGEADDWANGAAVDNKGNIYVAGYTDSPNFPTLKSYQEDQGNYDAFIAKLNAFPITLPNVLTAEITSITKTSADCSGDVTTDGGAEVTARGVCWNTSPGPTTEDNHTTDGAGTGAFDSSLTDLTPDTGYYIRAYATNAMGTAYGHEEFFETDESSITVTSPNDSEAWEVNSAQTITWTSKYVESNVKIEYSTDGGSGWTEITASTENDGSFPWTVPNVVSDECLIRVSETVGDTWSMSSAFFSIFTPSITVTSPNGGEIWRVNSQQTVSWNSTGTVGNVRIEYSTDEGNNWTDIIASTENDGSHPWTVPDAVSYLCLVRVSEAGGTPADESDKVFTIVAPTSLTVTSPNGGEIFYVGSIHTITWTSTGTVGNVKIKYCTDGGDQWTYITESTENDGSYAWTVPDAVSEMCLVRVSEIDDSRSDASDNLFAIRSNPTITVTSPNGGENLDVGSGHTITWTSEGVTGNVMLQYSVNGGSMWRTIVQSTENDGSYNWTVPNRPSDNCLVRISAGDPDGSMSDTSDWVFSITSLSTSTLTVTSPNGGEQLAAGSTHQITWTAEGTVEVPHVTIEYSTDRGTTWAVVAATLNNNTNGSFDWTVPNTPADSCLIRVRGTSSDGAPSDSSDDVFSILPLSSTALTLTFPNGGETWLVYSQQTITWETNGTVDNVKIDYSVNNGETWTEITASTLNTGSFAWGVPNAPSDTCLIRVSNADNGGLPSDISDSVFSISPVPALTVTSPNGGEQWNAGTSKSISWTSTGIVGAVTIEYSINGGENWIQITGNEPDSGSYDWWVPDTLSSNCLVRITADDTDRADPLFDVSDNVFTITEAQEPSLMVTSPNGGDSLFAGLTHEITWTSAGTVGNVAIDYSTNGGDTWTEISQSTENDGSYDWTVPDTPSGNCLVRVSETDGNPLDMSDSVFSILALPDGTITVTSPNGGETWQAGSNEVIEWDSTGDINDVTIQYSVNNGVSWITVADSTASDGSYNWMVPETLSDNCLIRIRAKIGDWDGGPSDSSNNVFSIFSPAPAALRVVFPNGGESWEVGSTQQIAWNSTANLENVSIAYSTNNGGSWITIEEAIADTGIYNWEIPDTRSEECLVRISAAISGNDEEVFDISDGNFSIVSAQTGTAITVLSPNGGENLYIGNSYDITWATVGIRDDITIEYSTNGGNGWTEIAAGISNTGSYEWTVPDEPSESCLIRISETSGTELDVSDAVFSISPLPVVPIEVLTPNGGENLEANSLYNITWTSNGIDNVIIEYSINNGLTWSYIGAAAASGDIFEWTVPQTGSENCLVRISGNDGGENPSDTSDAVFSITEPPQASVEVITPNGGENIEVGAEYNITWTSTDIQEVLIEYSENNGESWIEIDTVDAAGGRYTWTVPGTPSTECRVRISGNGDSDESDAVFSIVTNNP